MLIDALYTLAGFALLTWGADRFVAAAGSVAAILGVPPILIGLTVVGFATSAPEVLVSISAASQGLTGMAVGNALGSNITNIGLVLGATAVIMPISGEISTTLRREIPVLVVLTPLTLLMFIDGALDRIDALILLSGLAAFVFWMARTGMRLSARDVAVAEMADVELDTRSPWLAWLWILIGFGALLGGANLLVAGAESIAERFGLSDLVIGLTIVAIGTSLPELAVSVVSALRGDSSIAVGNVIGSNVFNLLAVIGAAGMVRPAELESTVLTLHYPAMILFTLVLLRLTYNPYIGMGIGRVLGACLLLAFFAYQSIVLGGS